MKLEDHLTEYGMSSGPVNKTPTSYTILHEDVKNLHVIGNCGESQYGGPNQQGCSKWTRNHAGNLTYGFCSEFARNGGEQPYHESDGCIHWEKKDV